MQTNLNKAIVVLPFAFMLHNVEETISMESWTRKNLSEIPCFITTRQFAIAVLIFSVLGFIAVFVKRFYKSEEQFLILITGFSGMLLLNVFFPHLIAVILFKMYAPGVLTALFINLPLTTFILWRIKTSSKILMKTMVFAVIIGGVSGVVFAYSFLLIGKLFSV